MSDHHKFTPCAQAVVEAWWPKDRHANVTPGQMLGMQRQLINCHFESMDNDTRERAARTIHWIDRQIESAA